MSGTELAYAATRPGVPVWGSLQRPSLVPPWSYWVQNPPMALQLYYGVCGTEQCGTLCCYAMPGTDLDYAAGY
eukprot:3523067-Rhodomonas_salina.1